MSDERPSWAVGPELGRAQQRDEPPAQRPGAGSAGEASDAAGDALRLPAAPPSFPRLPSGRPPARFVFEPTPAPRLSGLRSALIAVLAALLGGLVASGVTVAAVGGRDDDSAPARSVQAPVVEVARGRPAPVEAVAEAVLPTVVQINIRGGGTASDPAGNGSGVIYRSDGHIITNNHVVANGGDLQVVFADGSKAKARITGRDALSDLAVIKVERSELPAIQVGDASRLRVGQLAVAVGSPFGLEGSVTAGVISALNRPISVGNGVRLPNVIQTDAPINPGNSGGALVGADGRLIGINSAILTAGSPSNAGVGFAVPVDIAVAIADELIASGRVAYAFLGVEGQDVGAVDRAGLGVGRGALIRRVEPDTPAADAGLRADDVVVRFDSAPIESMDDLIVAVRQAEVGETVPVAYIRDGQRRSAEVTLVERPDEP